MVVRAGHVFSRIVNLNSIAAEVETLWEWELIRLTLKESLKTFNGMETISVWNKTFFLVTNYVDH